VGRTNFFIKDALAHGGTNIGISIPMQDLENKPMGTMCVSLFTARRYYTFFDLLFKNQLNIVPIIGMDFSMANLKMEDASVLHSLKPGVPNDYVDGLKGVNEAFAPYSNFFLSYGYGARTHTRGKKDSQDPCDLFATSGDFLNPYIHTQK